MLFQSKGPCASTFLDYSSTDWYDDISLNTYVYYWERQTMLLSVWFTLENRPFSPILFNICHLGSNSTFKDHGGCSRNSVQILIFCIQGITVVMNPWIYQKTKYCSYPAPAGQRYVHKKSENLEITTFCHIFAYFDTL